MTLEQFFGENTRAALAFSGGTDSAFLLWAAKEYGCDVRAYYMRTAFQPAFELADARRLAGELQVPMTVIEADILAEEAVAANASQRCYYCKNVLFRRIWQKALEDGYTLLLDGTNASDEAGDRPGMKALQELSVRSPLRECGLSKAQVRERSRAAGLFTWNKPAYACLATRIPAGTAITADMLCRVERAEDALTVMGFSDFRVRLWHDAARIQVTEAQMQKAVREQEQIVQALKPAFSSVFLDLEARKAETPAEADRVLTGGKENGK